MLFKAPPGIKIRTLPVSTRTAAAAAAALDTELGCIAKSLVFYSPATGQPVLIITSGANRVDKAKVGEHLGFRIKTAGPDYCLETTGYAVGGVPPFSHRQPLRTLLDRALLQYPVVWAAAGTPDSLFSISPQRLVQLSQAEIISVS